MKHYTAQYIARKAYKICQHMAEKRPWQNPGNPHDFKTGVFYRLPSGWRKNTRTRRIVSRVVNTYLGLGQTNYRAFVYRTQHIRKGA